MSSDKSLILKAFNNQLGEFCEDLVTVFPDNKDIKINKGIFDTVRKNNPRLIMQVWFSSITQPYSKEIGEGNYDFFINKDYTNDINIDKESDDKYLNLINSLRHEVNDLSVDNKEKTMKYVKNLVQLSTIYNK